MVIANGGTYCGIVIAVENEHGKSSSSLDKAVCISHSTNTFKKDMNSIILLEVMGELLGRLGSLTSVRQPI